MELDPRLGAGSGERASSLTNNPSDGITSASPSRHGALVSPANPDDDGADTPDVPAGLGSANTTHDADTDGHDPKRPRACEACRGLKVRCEPDPNGGPCKKCRKAGQSCVVTMPTRKRRKKTDSRVAELGKKIDALTASLQARAAPGGGQGHGHGHGIAGSPTVAQRSDNSVPASSYNITWRNTGTGPSWGSPAPTPSAMPPATTAEQDGRGSSAQPTTTPNTSTLAGQKRKFCEGREPSDERQRAEETPAESLASYLSGAKGGDIVERGLVTMEKAAELFARYNNHIAVHLPAVIFPPGFTVAELRKTKPTLFLAIMAAATAESPVLQKTLQKELMLVFAEKLMLTGEKSLELVQAINVTVIWYWPPEHFEEVKVYQLVHMAAVMAIDIGLGQKIQQRRGKVIPESWRQGPQNPSRRWTAPDPTSIESRRTWLTCYFLAVSTSMSLCRANLIRWNPFHAECVRILQSSPDAAPTDAYFCHLVWTHRLSEEVGIEFGLNDLTATISITDSRTQYALKGLELNLKEYSASVPPDMFQPTLKINFNMLSLYMHDVVLHSRATDIIRTPFSADSLRDGLVNAKLSAEHISSISSCLTSIDGLLTTFLSMDVFSVRCLPVTNFFRVTYAIVMLIKLYFSASAPGSEFGRIFNKEDMNVGKYLNDLLDKFHATTADDRCRPAAKFLGVLVMLRSWFYKQAKAEAKDSNSGLPPPPPSSIQQSPSQPTPINNSSSQPSKRPSTASIPLQLLSEVTTGTGAASGSRDPSAHPFFHDSTQSNDTANAGSGPGSSLPPPQALSSTMPSHQEPLSADLAAAVALVMPTLLPNAAGGVGGYNASDMDFSLGPGWDLEGMGTGTGSQGM